MTTYTPMKHQKVSIDFLAKNEKVFDMSDPGCVSADTEFLTPTGWKRIDKYVKGDLVAQFHPKTREIEFVAPLDYIKRPCTKMIAIAPTRGMSQRLSHEHRILFYRRDGSHGVKSAAEFMRDIHEDGPYRHNAKFCTTFSVKCETTLDLNDIEIRLMVAVIADGHFPSENKNRCAVRLKKLRKIQRLNELLIASKLDYKLRRCGGKDPDFHVFTFNAPRREKEFTAWWWGASQRQLEVIADEICYWDSHEDTRQSNGTQFCTLIEASADFAQYAFSAAKRPSSVGFAVRDRREQKRGLNVEYTVYARDENQFIGPGRADSVCEVPNPEGYKYCFEVPTSFLLLRHNGYIFATGNTGKTFIEIEDFAARRKKRGKCALVLATKSLLDSAWVSDIRKFAPHLTTSVAHATNREKAFAETADVYITNHDAVKWLATKNKAWFARFDTLIIDESSVMKHHTSQRSKAAAKISTFFTYIRLLSGTPNTNGVCDLWHQVFILDQGKRLGRSFFAFRSALCTPEQVGPSANAVRWRDKENAENIAASLISDIVIRHRFEDCVDIPANHQYTVDYYLNKKHMAAYKELEDNSILLLKKSSITAINGAVLYGKLLQLASGAAYNDNGQYSLVDSGRYDLILDLVQEREHSVVFFHWTHQRDHLIKRAKARGITYALIDGTVSSKQRDEAVKHYQAGFYTTLFAHPQSAGHGLTLTRGTATIWASPTHNLEHYLQGLKRIHRIGQKEKTETIMVIAPGTIEEQVYASLQAKDVKLTALLDYLKEAA